jgi:hypothetical protein
LSQQRWLPGRYLRVPVLFPRNIRIIACNWVQARSTWRPQIVASIKSGIDFDGGAKMRRNCEREIEKSVLAVQVGRTRNILRPVCIVCRRYLGKWDIRSGLAVCWRCRRYLPGERGKVEGSFVPQRLVFSFFLK